ncbi:hypothetical protein ACGFYQ_41745 [Streptomyces sp. NPDC048258]|uniref:hypothetical protein n=1 Tax=Streptomyces sp. NPDC048258 TaxID=3365527 RepID=UPI00371560CE
MGKPLLSYGERAMLTIMFPPAIGFGLGSLIAMAGAGIMGSESLWTVIWWLTVPIALVSAVLIWRQTGKPESGGAAGSDSGTDYDGGFGCGSD